MLCFSRNPRAAILCFIRALKENVMGIFEELAGAVVAVEGVKKLDPNASIITEGIAAVAGYKGVEEVTEHLEKKPDDPEQAG